MTENPEQKDLSADMAAADKPEESKADVAPSREESMLSSVVLGKVRDDMPWYVVRIATGCEKQVLNALREKVSLEKLQDFFGEVLVPTEEVIEYRGGQHRKTRRRFYPGYMLIQMDMNDSTWYVVRKTSKVLGFVGGLRDKPAPISRAEAEKVIGKVRASQEGQPKPKVLYQVGEMVRVTEGPFADFNGVVEEINYEKRRLKVSVLIFGRSTPVNLEFSQVERTNH